MPIPPEIHSARYFHPTALSPFGDEPVGQRKPLQQRLLTSFKKD